MGWRPYWTILRRRWLLIALILALDLVITGFLFARSYRHVGYQACSSLFVADSSAPSIVSASSSSVSTAELLAGESAANFFADDILDIAQSNKVADYVSRKLSPRSLPNASSSDLRGSIGGARHDRTVGLCVSSPQSQTAVAASQVLVGAMSTNRATFIGRALARRTYVGVISTPTVSRVSSRHELVNAALRLLLGALVAVGLALLWDALDPRMRDEQDVEQTTGVPVLASFR